MKKACILAAGFGSRLSFSGFSNKALLPVGDRAAISIILDSIPEEIEVVIAVNYMKEDLINYLDLVERHRVIQYVHVPSITGDKSGPGASLLACKNQINEPFVLLACDSIPITKIDFKLTTNWMATSIEENTVDYLNVSTNPNGMVRSFYDKQLIPKDIKGISSFSGIAGIFNYKEFFQALEKDKTKFSEIQVLPGFEGIKDKEIKNIQNFEWIDLGTQDKYESFVQKTDKVIRLEKKDEYIYFEKGMTIKFFKTEKKALNMISRVPHLGDTPPPSINSRGRFLAHKYVKGHLLGDCNDDGIMKRFLDFINSELWVKEILVEEISDTNGMQFYKVKTKERVDELICQGHVEVGEIKVNGIKLRSIETQLSNIDWTTIIKYKPSLFHGDPQPENIVCRGNDWTLIDWRENFGGNTILGDKYYDLAKIYHALFVSGKSVRCKQFQVEKQNNDYLIYIKIQENHKTMIYDIEDWIKFNGLDLSRVRMLSALILLNIAPLHDKEYGEFLYYYGRYLLELNSKQDWVKFD
jgi:dTDP-glucose pyrophosphorylase